MLKIIKLQLYRIIHNKAFLITYLVLIPLVIGMAIYITNSMSFHMRLGVVGDMMIVSNDNVDYVYLDEIPRISQIVLNEYDAILIQEDDKINVMSTKGNDFNQMVLLLVNGQIDELPTDSQRGSATNIIGFLMMVVFLLGVQIYKYYFDERHGINKRIMSTSVHCYEYLLSHFIVVFLFLFIPASLVIVGSISIFDITLSISLGLFILVLLLLCVFATSFGLWINVLSRTMEDSMNFGNMFAIVGTIVSGGLVAVTDHKIFHYITQIFPQKQIMSLLSSLENQTSLPTLGIIYVIVISVILVVIAIRVEKRKISYR